MDGESQLEAALDRKLLVNFLGQNVPPYRDLKKSQLIGQTFRYSLNSKTQETEKINNPIQAKCDILDQEPNKNICFLFFMFHDSQYFLKYFNHILKSRWLKGKHFKLLECQCLRELATQIDIYRRMHGSSEPEKQTKKKAGGLT